MLESDPRMEAARGQEVRMRVNTHLFIELITRHEFEQIAAIEEYKVSVNVFGGLAASATSTACGACVQQRVFHPVLERENRSNSKISFARSQLTDHHIYPTLYISRGNCIKKIYNMNKRHTKTARN